MDFGKAFTFMFDDPNWLRKLGIGTLVGLLGIMLMPILIGVIPLIMVTGYCLDALRNVAEGREFPMPEWNEWGNFLIRGLKLIAAFFVWSLPLLLVGIPLGLGAALAGNQSDAGPAIGALLMMCASCLTFLWGLFLLLISPAIYIRLAVTGRLGAAFEIGKLWVLTRDNLGNVILALILVFVAGLIAAIIGSLGLLLLCVGFLITVPLATLWQYLVQAHLFGQIGRYSVTPIE
ncbi:MAG: DUF4013 domain-containing protein [Anaerolineae bacterium]|jgi:hypothetical protein|nr:DUF4013 domain-containing protein [Anaerolineae bacterium]